MNSTIANQFQRWNNALLTEDPKKVAALYAPHAILLPTVSNQVRTTNEQIEDYFTKFLKLRPKGKIDEQHVRILDQNHAINSGIYTFSLNDKQSVQARFTFVYQKINGKWFIIEHHSSKMPE